MRLRIFGNPRKVNKELARDAMNFYIESLLGSDTDDLKIHVKFIDNLVRDTNYKAHSQPTVKAFILGIDSNLTQRATLKCLAHEIVHIKQFACRELVYHATDDNLVLWHGEEMVWNQKDVKYYYNTPWEIEANSREVGLYELYRIHLYNKIG
jgi:hypothetical protein